MAILDIFKRKKAVPAAKSAAKRSFSVFAAAAINRLTDSMAIRSQSMDWDLRLALPILRARSRSLTVNNDIAAKFLQMVATHVVGPNGFSYQVRVSEPDMKGGQKIDKLASDAIEKAFADWMRVGNCDVTGKHSFFDIQNLFAKGVAREGEVLIRKVYGKEAGPYGFALQLLDTDRLDVLKNEILDNGGAIKMGVEINQFGKPVAYWIRPKHPGDSAYYTVAGVAYQRIPADEIFHLFIPLRPEQNRGVPWMHSAIMRLQNLGGYEEAAVIAARVGAAKMGFFTAPEGDGTALAQDQGTDGSLYTTAEAGEFGVLPPGYGFENFNPDYPHQQYGDFVKANLRGIASGLGVAYNTLANDLEGVNFSSIRSGVLEERDNWMVIQRWMIENFLDPVFKEWLKFALLNKMIVLPNGSTLPMAKYDKFNACTWRGRRWQWVDPLKDVEANVMAVNNGFKTREAVVSEQGGDLDDVFMGLKAEQDQIEELDLSIALPTDATTVQADAAGKDALNTDGAQNGNN
jgi:lambda family phage portal protein